MKDKKQYSRSFARRLSKRVVLALLLVMGCATFLIALFSWGTSLLQATMLYNAVLTGTNQYVRTILSDVYVGTINNVSNVEDHLDRPDELPDILKHIVEQNPRIQNCGLSFTAHYYPQKGRLYAPFARRHADGTISVNRTGDLQHDYLVTDGFRQGIESKEGRWTKAYFDCVDTLMPVVSYTVPIRNRAGRAVALLVCDLSLSHLRDKLNETDEYINDKENNYGDGCYSFIIERDGTFLVHPDQARILRGNFMTQAAETPDTLDDYVGRLMVSGKEGFYGSDNDGNDLVIEGKEVFVYYAPVKYVDWTVAIAVPRFNITLWGYVLAGICVFLIGLAVLVTVLVCSWSIRRAVKPLKVLATTTDEVAKGNFDTQLPTMKSRDEVHMLRDSFEGMQQSLKLYVAQLRETTAQQASMESELKIAHDIQMSMLPKQFPPYPERTDVDVFGSVQPAKGVGGDLFDFFIRDEQLYFCIGDVSGKGVPASLVMAVTCAQFRSVSTNMSDPAAITMSLNELITAHNDANMFVTLFVGVLDLRSGQLRYCNAGHIAPLVVGREVSELPCDPNLPVGVMPDWQFSLQEATIARGSLLFLYTDGLSEGEDSTHAQFGDERVLAVAQALCHEGVGQPAAVVGRMREAVAQFVGDAEQSDDLTMLAIRY